MPSSDISGSAYYFENSKMHRGRSSGPLNVLTVHDRIRVIMDAITLKREFSDSECSVKDPPERGECSSWLAYLVPEKLVNAVSKNNREESCGWQLHSIIVDLGAAEMTIRTLLKALASTTTLFQKPSRTKAMSCHY